MLAIPNGLDQGVTQIIQQWKKDERDQKTNVDKVQILERMAIECKNQMATLTEEGSKKLQQCEKADGESEGKKWQVFLKAAWEKIHEQITGGCRKWEPISIRMLGVN